jgi:hypothetical protein
MLQLENVRLEEVIEGVKKFQAEEQIQKDLQVKEQIRKNSQAEEQIQMLKGITSLIHWN